MPALRTVENPARGCGRLKEGGFYARGDTSSNGGLLSWSWTFGEHVIGGRNLTICVPARQMQVINLPATLEMRRLATEPIEIASTSPLARLPQVALLDHVGSEFYTPWSFAVECGKHGPSRRIPQNIAKAIAKHTPIPIAFTHSWLPIVDEDYWGDLCRWSNPDVSPDRHVNTPTYESPEWGIQRGDWRGEHHWMFHAVSQMHFAGKGEEKHLSEIMPHELAENTLLAEQIYGTSWITRCVYIAREDDSDETLSDIAESGIEPVRAEEVNHDTND